MIETAAFVAIRVLALVLAVQRGRQNSDGRPRSRRSDGGGGSSGHDADGSDGGGDGGGD